MHPDTSSSAYSSVSVDMLADHYKKILNALSVLGTAIYEEIAKHIGWEDKNRVSRRLRELEGMQLVYKTGGKKLTSSNRNANVYAKVENKELLKEEIPTKTTAIDFSNFLINKTKMGKLKQCELFKKEMQTN
jgi:hypothetical protein